MIFGETPKGLPFWLGLFEGSQSVLHLFFVDRYEKCVILILVSRVLYHVKPMRIELKYDLSDLKGKTYGYYYS